jgi:hypothetical protein
MHVGKLYPYAYEFWQCEVQFWPGFVPRKIFAQTVHPNGDAWDLLLGGIVSDVMLPDAFLVGDPLWSYTEPMGFFVFEFFLHKIQQWPKRYSAVARLQVPGPAACAISTGIGPELRSFGGYPWSLISGPSPPDFNGNIPALTIRAATWSEV